VAAKDWARRRLIEAESVTDPAERTVHGLMLLVRPAVERLRGLGYVTFGRDFEMQCQLEGDKWRESQWGPEIEAIRAAFDKAKQAVAPAIADGKLSKAEALSRIHAALPGDWDRVRRGVVAEELLAALQQYLTNDTDNADNGQAPPQTEAVPEPVVPPSAGDGSDTDNAHNGQVPAPQTEAVPEPVVPPSAGDGSGTDNADKGQVPAPQAEAVPEPVVPPSAGAGAGGQGSDDVQHSAAPEEKPAAQQPAVLDINGQGRPAPEEKPAEQGGRIVHLPVGELSLHKSAADIPAMTPEEWELFLEDVRARGVEAALVVQKGGVILDGRSRWEAAKQCGLEKVPVVLVELSDDEQVIAMYRAAVVRRNLGDDQRAMLAQDYLELLSRRGRNERARKAGLAGGKGRPKAGNSSGAKLTPKLSGPDKPAVPEPRRRSREQAAAALNVSPSKLRAAKELAGEDPEAAAEVRGGKKTLRRARKDLKAKKSARGDTGKSAKTPADARGQGAPKTKARPKGAVGSSSGEFRAVTQALDKVGAALAAADGEFSEVASRLTGEARKKLKARLGKLGSRLDELHKLIAQEDG
jgi:hypothetical protein